MISWLRCLWLHTDNVCSVQGYWGCHSTKEADGNQMPQSWWSQPFTCFNFPAAVTFAWYNGPVTTAQLKVNELYLPLAEQQGPAGWKEPEIQGATTKPPNPNPSDQYLLSVPQIISGNKELQPPSPSGNTINIVNTSTLSDQTDSSFPAEKKT